MCEQMLMPVTAQGGCTDTPRESALKVDSGRKIPCLTGNQTCLSSMLVRLSANELHPQPRNVIFSQSGEVMTEQGDTDSGN